MIRLEGVRKSYPGQSESRPALDGITLEIHPGEMLAIVGPNGSGKSTLLGMLSGVLRPTGGKVTGNPVRSVVLQRTALDGLLSVRENAMLFARVYGVAKPDRERRLVEMAAMTGLADRLGDRVGTLSGGLARRADLLRAVMVGPELLILDEPAAGLDRESHAGVMASLVRLRERLRMAVVMATHDMGDAGSADRVMMLREGRIAADGPPPELIAGLGAEVVVERSGGVKVPCTRQRASQLTAELLARSEAFSVREVSLGDVYDRAMGAEL